MESREGGGGRKNKQKEDFYLGIVLRRKRKDSRSRAIATKAVQVCTSLLLEFLPIFDFSVCSIPEYLIVLLSFVWTKRATICFVEIGYLPVSFVLILDVINVFGSIYLCAYSH